MKQNALSRFESLAQRLVEGSFSRLLGGQLEPLDVAARIAQLMEDGQKSGKPTSHFNVFLNPQDLENVYKQYPQIKQDLTSYVKQLADQTELPQSEQLEVSLLPDPHLNRNQIVVTAVAHDQPRSDSTQVFEQAQPSDSVPEALLALDAFLIVEGRRHVALIRPLTTLGRHVDNDIVLDSATVSRRHAQIRWRFGYFILYDISNRGRTFVNGEAVTEHVLQSGDVIGVSDTLLIYAEDQEWNPLPAAPKAKMDVTQPRRVEK